MRRSPLLAIFLVAFVGMLSYGIIIPITPFYAQSFGASDFTIGLLIGSYALMQFIFAPILGRLSDRFGRRPLLLVSLAGTVGSLILFGFANSLVLLFVGRILDGITGGNISIAQAYVSDVTTPENRARGMGMIGAALGLGFIVGPAIGGFLSRNGNYQLPIFVAAGIATLSFVLTAFLLPEPPRTTEYARQARTFDIFRLVRAFAHPRIGRLLQVTLLVALAFTAFETTFALFAARRLGYGSMSTGYALAYIGIVVALVQGGLIRRLAKKFGEGLLIVAGALLLGLSLLLLGFIQTTLELVLVGMLLAAGEGVLTPSLSSLVSRRSLPSEQGEHLGLYQSMGSFARIIAPLSATWLLQRAGLAVPYMIGGGLVLLASVLAVQFIRPETSEELGVAASG
ncbi:MAG: MFS transporter [Herpetosiphonaceae bacterium]|nr:MFS transporter [Herpetosiphonaceae bacterium]